MNAIRKFLRTLGPGLITGVADDDPSGIATYSQTGAQFGYGQLWTALFMLPLMIAIQEACARIGAVKGKGIAAVIKTHYGKKILYPVVFLLAIANTINIGADIGAMAEATNLIVPVNFVVLIFLFAFFILMLEIFLSYKTYSNILKWLCIFIFAYPITMFMVDAPWMQILQATFIPQIELNFQFLFIITGLFGTTISPYLFIWQSSQEVEEDHKNHLIDHNGKARITKAHLKRIRIDNVVGMLFSQLTCWAIIVVAGTVLHTHGVTDIKSAADAAKALEPFVQSFPHAGFLAKFIFAIGIIGLGLIAVPVLAGSVAYALCETLNWREGLNLKLKSAHGFYGVITAATLIGLVINFIGIDPMKALVYAAVINGVVAVPLIFIIGLIANSEKIMGQFKSRKLSNLFIIITFLGMASSVIAMFISFGKG